MSSLNNILNPDSMRETEDSQKSPISMRSRSSSPSLVDEPMETIEKIPPKESYYQSSVTIRPHEAHENCPDTLDCLPDTNGRPQHTLPVILRCAILGSPKKKLTIREIYAAMEKKYPYYSSAGPAWKQSVRHHLSLNRLFERQPRPATEPGFGSYWTVNLEAPPGTKRPRKRGVRKEAPPPEPMHYMQGRPDRSHEQRRSPYSYSGQRSEPRLRPVDAFSFHAPGVRNGRDYDYDGSVILSGSEDDELESEEEAPREPFRYDPHMNLATASAATLVNPEPMRGSLHGAFATQPYHMQVEPPHNTIHRLQNEVEHLKKQMTEAVSVSYQMGQQLKEAKEKAAHYKEMVTEARDEVRALTVELDEYKRARGLPPTAYTRPQKR